MTNASLSFHVSAPPACCCPAAVFRLDSKMSFFFCSVAISVGLRGTSGDNQSDTASLASWTATRQLLRYMVRLNGAAKAAEARQHTASPKVLCVNVGHVSSSALTVQTWRLLLHRKNVLYAGVFFFFFIRGFPPELSLAERILVLMI